MSESNVISIQDVLKSAMQRTSQSPEQDDVQPMLQVEDCGNGYAYLIVGRRLPWQDAMTILNQYYNRTTS